MKGKRRNEWEYLPSSFDAVEIRPIKGSGKYPKLRKTELVDHLDGWVPHVYGGLCPIHLLRSSRVGDRMLH